MPYFTDGLFFYGGLSPLETNFRTSLSNVL
jgi:hypothetical protein